MICSIYVLFYIKNIFIQYITNIILVRIKIFIEYNIKNDINS